MKIFIEQLTLHLCIAFRFSLFRKSCMAHFYSTFIVLFCQFWGLNLIAICVDLQHADPSEHHLLRSVEESKSFRIGTTWGWVHDDRTLIPVNSSFKSTNVNRFLRSLVSYETIFDITNLALKVSVCVCLYKDMLMQINESNEACLAALFGGVSYYSN